MSCIDGLDVKKDSIVAMDTKHPVNDMHNKNFSDFSSSACSSDDTLTLEAYEQWQWMTSVANSLNDSDDYQKQCDLLSMKLSKYHFKERIPIPGDGNCQFSAIQKELQRIHHPLCHLSTHALRQLAIQEVIQHLEFYQSFCDENVEVYVKSMLYEQDAMVRWGDEITLVALVHALGVSVMLISSGFPEPMYYHPTTKQTTEMIYLCHWANLHYGVIEASN